MKERYLDTNIFIRHLIGDVPEQLEKTKEVFASIEKKEVRAIVSVLVVNEIIWILEHYYKIDRKTYIPKLEKLLLLENIKMLEIKKEIILKILGKMKKQKFDFTDFYLSELVEHGKLLTFDKDFEKIYK